MKSFKERIEVNNNQDKDRATHKHSNGDLYVKADEPHEFGEWLNFKHSSGFWTKSFLITQNESVLTPIKKPTPTKFVKVEESIFDLRDEFERGELYFSEWGEEKTFAKIKKEHRLMNNLNSGNVYRQVEIDWRDEVVKFLNDDNIGDSGPIKGHLKGEMSDIDWDYFAESDFIEMCHLVASLTEKPEGV